MPPSTSTCPRRACTWSSSSPPSATTARTARCSSADARSAGGDALAVGIKDEEARALGAGVRRVRRADGVAEEGPGAKLAALVDEDAAQHVDELLPGLVDIDAGPLGARSEVQPQAARLARLAPEAPQADRFADPARLDALDVEVLFHERNACRRRRRPASCRNDKLRANPANR